MSSSDFKCCKCKKEVDLICELGIFHPLKNKFPLGYCEPCFKQEFPSDTELPVEEYSHTPCKIENLHQKCS